MSAPGGQTTVDKKDLILRCFTVWFHRGEEAIKTTVFAHLMVPDGGSVGFLRFLDNGGVVQSYFCAVYDVQEEEEFTNMEGIIH